MTLPTQMPANQEDRRVLGEFYDTWKNSQWFDRAEIIDNHPTQMKKTLEIYVKYKPILETKEILGFTHKYNIALSVVVLKND